MDGLDKIQFDLVKLLSANESFGLLSRNPTFR
jgi:hypothetical protein